MATIPQVAHAIDFHGDCGARFMLDVAECEFPGFLPVLTMRGKRLKVSIVVEE